MRNRMVGRGLQNAARSRRAATKLRGMDRGLVGVEEDLLFELDLLLGDDDVLVLLRAAVVVRRARLVRALVVGVEPRRPCRCRGRGSRRRPRTRPCPPARSGTCRRRRRCRRCRCRGRGSRRRPRTRPCPRGRSGTCRRRRRCRRCRCRGRGSRRRPRSRPCPRARSGTCPAVGDAVVVGPRSSAAGIRPSRGDRRRPRARCPRRCAGARGRESSRPGPARASANSMLRVGQRQLARGAAQAPLSRACLACVAPRARRRPTACPRSRRPPASRGQEAPTQPGPMTPAPDSRGTGPWPGGAAQQGWVLWSPDPAGLAAAGPAAAAWRSCSRTRPRAVGQLLGLPAVFDGHLVFGVARLLARLVQVFDRGGVFVGRVPFSAAPAWRRPRAPARLAETWFRNSTGPQPRNQAREQDAGRTATATDEATPRRTARERPRPCSEVAKTAQSRRTVTTPDGSNAPAARTRRARQAVVRHAARSAAARTSRAEPPCAAPARRIRDIDLTCGSRHPPQCPPGGQSVNQLIAYLLDHAMLDFSGDLTLDMIRDFLRNDDSPAARALLAKLVQERRCGRHGRHPGRLPAGVPSYRADRRGGPRSDQGLRGELRPARAPISLAHGRPARRAVARGRLVPGGGRPAVFAARCLLLWVALSLAAASPRRGPAPARKLRPFQLTGVSPAPTTPSASPPDVDPALTFNDFPDPDTVGVANHRSFTPGLYYHTGRYWVDLGRAARLCSRPPGDLTPGLGYTLVVQTGHPFAARCACSHRPAADPAEDRPSAHVYPIPDRRNRTSTRPSQPRAAVGDLRPGAGGVRRPLRRRGCHLAAASRRRSGDPRRASPTPGGRLSLCAARRPRRLVGRPLAAGAAAGARGAPRLGPQLSAAQADRRAARRRVTPASARTMR